MTWCIFVLFCLFWDTKSILWDTNSLFWKFFSIIWCSCGLDGISSFKTKQKHNVSRIPHLEHALLMCDWHLSSSTLKPEGDKRSPLVLDNVLLCIMIDGDVFLSPLGTSSKWWQTPPTIFKWGSTSWDSRCIERGAAAATLLHKQRSPGALKHKCGAKLQSVLRLAVHVCMPRQFVQLRARAWELLT